MSEDVPGRLDAIRLLREDRARTTKLLRRLSTDLFVETGLGGGAWSPKDLVGHLETWEQHALDALEAIERGEPAPIAQQQLDTDALNLREVERKAGLSAEAIARSAATTHGRLLAALEALPDERWNAPEGEGTERTVADRLGSILGGSRGFFRHDPDHWDDLETFAAVHASG
jgi:uncharacterized damage-inducible protein DinB